MRLPPSSAARINEGGGTPARETLPSRRTAIEAGNTTLRCNVRNVRYRANRPFAATDHPTAFIYRDAACAAFARRRMSCDHFERHHLAMIPCHENMRKRERQRERERERERETIFVKNKTIF